MKKLLVVCGPTGVGKTSLGGQLAKKFKGEIVSADSRQVYKGFNIATGKERPRGVKTWLLDVASPKEKFSVAQYFEHGRKAVEDIWRRKKMPVVVGGTGLYIKALVDGIETLNIPPNIALRKRYAEKTPAELLDLLFGLDPELAFSLNRSERKNKTRLIRRIEIAQTGLQGKVVRGLKNFDVLFLGLRAPAKTIRKRLAARINGWIKKGAAAEIRRLLKKGLDWEDQSMGAIGYRVWREFFAGRASLKEVKKKWEIEEWQYARRQLTWFKNQTFGQNLDSSGIKKNKRINWFDITISRWQQKVEKLVEKWYDSG